MPISSVIDELLARMTGGAGGPPHPARVLVFEANTVAADGRMLARDLLTVDAYSPRFEELLAIGYAWINVSFYGLLEDGTGVVGIEHPSTPPERPLAQTSINFSGAENRVRDAGWDVRRAVELPS